MKHQASLTVGTAAAVFALFATFFAFREAAPDGSGASASPSPAVTPPRVARDASSRSSLPTRPAQFTVSAPAPAADDGLLLDEAALMDTLRELRGSDPNLTLQLAREGNQRFQDSAGAAERSWFIVKALSDLGRHDEARLEGRVLVEKYRDTRWAEDVYRHLFVNPPTHPFERGYGKKLESDPPNPRHDR
jgi:hypothetical protein